jgi:flagellar export protein FliJ
MSNNKQQRLKRIVDLRAKEVDRRVKELSQARTRENQMAQELEEARAQRQRELDLRNERAQAGLPAGDWGQAETWLVGLAQKEAIAEKQRELATREVVGARGRVAEAMVEREKIERLVGRVADEMRKEQVRVERKNEDEHASIHGAKSAANGKRGA